MTDQQPPSWRFTAAPVDPDAERTALARVAEHEAASTKAAEWLAKHSQQPAAEQLLNLADRAERGPLTAAEVSRLREGVNELYAHLNDAAGDRDSWARDARQAEHERDRYCAAWHNACRRAATLRHVARSNLRHVQAIVPDLEAATQRAERAEAAIERVTSLVRHYEQWGATGWQPYSAKPSQVAREFRAALDEHQEQPPS